MAKELKEYYSRLQWKQAANEALSEGRRFFMFCERNIYV
jgi:hypothetical protein